MNLEYQHINYFERDKMNLEDKIKIVENILKDKKVAVGFSGGADSTLIAYRDKGTYPCCGFLCGNQNRRR